MEEVILQYRVTLTFPHYYTGNMRKDLKVLGLLVIVLVSLYAGGQRRATISNLDTGVIPGAGEAGINIGDRAPNFILESLDGGTLKLSDHKGKGVIINFWATWCVFCGEEMLLFEKAYQEHGAELEVLGVNLGERTSVIQPYVKEKGLSFPILLDPEGEVKNAYDAWTQPVSYFIDRNGVIVVKKFGPLTEGELSENIEKTLDVEFAETTTGGEEIMVTKGVKHLVPLDKLRSGGPPKDGIPAIDHPKFISIGEASFLKDEDVVLGLNYNGVARAYPLMILNWHEIVNDFVAGDPVLVTYCPLCGTGIAYERKINGEAVEFGVSGKLYNSDLVMYDRKTDTYWDQITGRAIVGELTGMRLKQIPIDTVRFSDWKKAHPDTVVLSTDTGSRRDYTDNPYLGYDEVSAIYFSVDNLDERLHPKAVVHGVELEDRYVAFPDSELAKGSTVEYVLDGKTLTVEKNDFGIVSVTLKETGSEIVPVRGFWFAWAAFHPDTELYQP